MAYAAQMTMPVANPTLAAGIDASRTMQLSALAGKLSGQPAPGTAAPQATPAAIGALAAGATAQAGQQRAAAATTAAQGAAAGQQLALGQQRSQIAQATGERQIGLQERAADNEAKLAGLDRSLKEQLLDAQMQFQTDAMGRTVFQEGQLLDWAASKAKNAEEFKDYQQTVQQAADRHRQMLTAVQKKIANAMEMDAKGELQGLDQETRKELKEAAAQVERQLAAAEAAASQRAAMIGGLFTVGGAAVGGFFGGPAGAGAGASVGQGIGGLAAGVT